MRKLIIGLAMATLSTTVVSTAFAADKVSMAVPGSSDAAGRKVLTFIAKDPPGVRCNGNLQVAAEVANTYRVPIQLLPSFQPGSGSACPSGVLRQSDARGRWQGLQRRSELSDRQRRA